MKKYIAALCLLGLFAGMAGGCGGQGAGTPQTPQLAGELNLEQAGELSYTAQSYAFSDGLTAIVPQAEGYLLFSQTGTCRLTDAFAQGGDWSAQGSNCAAAAALGQTLYTVALQPDGSSAILYRDETPLCELPAGVVLSYCLLPVEAGVYAACPFRQTLWYNGTEMELPQEHFFRGFWTLAGQNWAVAEKMEGGTDVLAGVYLFPLDGPDLGEPVLLTGWTENIHTLSTDGTYSYCLAGGQLYRTDGSSVQCAGSLVDYGVDPHDLQSLLPLADGRLLLLESGRLTVLTPGTGPVEAAEVQVACYLYAPYEFESWAAQYNREQDQVTLQVTVYQTQAELNLALLSGEVDLLASADPALVEGYGARGVLAPLDTLLAEALAQDWVMENVVEAGRVDGALYYLPTQISLYAMRLPAQALAPYGGGFTDVAQLQACLDSLDNQSFYQKNIKEYVLTDLLLHGLSAWVDYEAGTCDFTGESFLWVLEHANRYAEDTQEVFANQDENRPLFDPRYWLSDLQQWTGLRLAYEIPGTEEPFSAFGMEGAVFAPPFGGGTGLAIGTPFVLAIAAGTAQEQACAAFLRWVLSPEQQWQWADSQRIDGGAGFSVNEAVIQRYLEKHSPEEAEDAAGLIALLKSADHYGSGGLQGGIKAIIQEEAQAYFAGDRTVEECAELIQNRASIYLAEQG